LLRTSISLFEEGLNAGLASSPLFWAGVQVHIASSYLELARLNNNRTDLEQAQEHVSMALEVLLPTARGGITDKARELVRQIEEFESEMAR
jgi:hypothetical protein